MTWPPLRRHGATDAEHWAWLSYALVDSAILNADWMAATAEGVRWGVSLALWIIAEEALNG